MQIIYLALHIVFGLGILWFVMRGGGDQILGQAGACIIVSLGLVERIAALVTQQWLFVLGFILLLQ